MRLSPNYHGLLAFIGSARATNSHRAQMLKALMNCFCFGRHVEYTSRPVNLRLVQEKVLTPDMCAFSRFLALEDPPYLARRLFLICILWHSVCMGTKGSGGSSGIRQIAARRHLQY